MLRLTVAADDGSERLVSTARTTETTYRFRQLALGRYTLTVRAVNARGQQGDPASVSFRIAAPAAPSQIELTPGYFQITATPHLAVYDPTVQFEFWFSETKISDVSQVDKSARYLGTALYWVASGQNIKPGHDYYFYVRSVNTVGKSAFVEAVGQPGNNPEEYLNFFEGKINSTLLGQELNDRINASALRSEVEQLEDEVNQRLESDIAGVTQKIGETENSLTQLVAKKNDEQSLAISQVSQKVDNVSSELTQTVSQSNEENARQIAQVRQYVDEKSSEIISTTDKKLGEQEATIQQIQKVQTDTSNNLNSMWAVKLQQMQDGRLYIAGIGAGIENTPDGMQSQVLLAADRIAFINPENGNTTPALVTQGGQTFINEALIKTLIAPTITSGGSPPVFSLTSDGKLTAKNADISGSVNANAGTLN
ncbi:DUF1983 domain-containing protein, partial [Escherichia coli]|nr:DUF1983 domain-containing protein [Escherichia coli]